MNDRFHFIRSYLMRILKALFKSLNFDWEQMQNSSELLEGVIEQRGSVLNVN